MMPAPTPIRLVRSMTASRRPSRLPHSLSCSRVASELWSSMTTMLSTKSGIVLRTFPICRSSLYAGTTTPTRHPEYISRILTFLYRLVKTAVVESYAEPLRRTVAARGGRKEGDRVHDRPRCRGRRRHPIGQLVSSTEAHLAVDVMPTLGPRPRGSDHFSAQRNVQRVRRVVTVVVDGDSQAVLSLCLAQRMAAFHRVAQRQRRLAAVVLRTVDRLPARPRKSTAGVADDACEELCFVRLADIDLAGLDGPPSWLGDGDGVAVDASRVRNQDRHGGRFARRTCSIHSHSECHAGGKAAQRDLNLSRRTFRRHPHEDGASRDHTSGKDSKSVAGRDLERLVEVSCVEAVKAPISPAGEACQRVLARDPVEARVAVPRSI